MANYATLKAAINAVIKANGNKEITGTVLNETLTAMVNSLGADYQFAGVATPSTNPGTPDQNVFYLAGQAGTYTNFNGIVLPDGVSIIKWNGSWSSETVLAGDGVFDISAYKATGGALATFADLSSALDGGNNIPSALRKGGMSVKFVQSSDNKYVQYRLIKNTFSTAIYDWRSVGNISNTDFVDCELETSSGYISVSDGSIVPGMYWIVLKYDVRNVKSAVIFNDCIAGTDNFSRISFWDENNEYLRSVCIGPQIMDGYLFKKIENPDVAYIKLCVENESQALVKKLSFDVNASIDSVLGVNSRKSFSSKSSSSQYNTSFNYNIEEGVTYCFVNTGNVAIPCYIYGSDYSTIYVKDGVSIEIGESIIFTATNSVNGIIMTLNGGDTSFYIYKLSKGIINLLLQVEKGVQRINTLTSSFGVLSSAKFTRTVETGTNASFDFPIENGSTYCLVNNGIEFDNTKIFGPAPSYTTIYDNIKEIKSGDVILFKANVSVDSIIISIKPGTTNFAIYKLDVDYIFNFIIKNQVVLNNNIGICSSDNFSSTTDSSAQYNKSFNYNVESGGIYYITNIGDIDIPCYIYGSDYSTIYVADDSIAPGEIRSFIAPNSVNGITMTLNGGGETKFNICKLDKNSIINFIFNELKKNDILGAESLNSFEKSSGGSYVWEMSYQLTAGERYLLINKGEKAIPSNSIYGETSDGNFHPLYSNQVEIGNWIILTPQYTDPILRINADQTGENSITIIKLSKNGFLYGLKDYQKSINVVGINQSGKTWNAVGDSLTAGTYYQNKVKDIIDINYSSYGVGGCTICINSNAPEWTLGKSIVERVCAMGQNEPIPDADIWTLFGGLNDSLCNSTLGQIAAAGSTFDDTTIYGALQKSVEHILSLKARQRLILIVPAQSTYDLLDETEHPTTMRMIRKAIIDVAEYYALPVVDLWTKSGINQTNISRETNPTTNDGVHWSGLGQSMASPLIAKAISESFFGDNIY